MLLSTPKHHGPAAAAARPQRPAARPRTSYEDLAAKYADNTEEHALVRHKSNARGLVITVATIMVGALALAGYAFYSKNKRETEGKIAKLLKVMQDELAHDSFAGYKAACDAGEKIVSDLDPKLFSAHAYLAYAYAIRWGEHGEGTSVEEPARDHLTKAKAAGQEHAHLIAAEAYLRYFGGEQGAAVSSLAKFVTDNEKARKSPLLLGTLGILQMHEGDLDEALKNLKLAQSNAPADARLNAALGNVLRRQGNEFQASNSYEQALRYEKDHAEAQLGVALMAIDAGKLDPSEKRFETANKYIQRLLSADPPPSIRQQALARMAHAILLDEQGKRDEADREEQKALNDDAKNGELQILRSRRLARANRPDEAVAAIRQALKLEPKRAGFYVELARALLHKEGGAREAESSMEEALKSMPGSPKLLILLGDARRAAGAYDKAREAYEKALAQANDKLPEARLALADVARAKKDYPKALDLYEKAKNELLVDPRKQAYALTQMGLITEESDKNKARDFYRKATEVDQTFGPPYFLVGRMYVSDKKNRAFAFELIDRYLKLEPKGEYSAEAQRYMAEKPH